MQCVYVTMTLHPKLQDQRTQTWRSHLGVGLKHKEDRCRMLGSVRTILRRAFHRGTDHNAHPCERRSREETNREYTPI
jgi:hypothetical protein